MKKTEQIRSYVRDHAGDTGCSVDEIAQSTGLDHDYVLTKSGLFARWGQFDKVDGGRFTWNANWKPLPRGEGGAAASGRKLQGFRAAARAKKAKRKAVSELTLHELAEKHAAPITEEGITPQGHVRTALDAFVETIDVQSLDPMSRLALRSLTEAVALVGRA